jgi:hypothetical protein
MRGPFVCTHLWWPWRIESAAQHTTPASRPLAREAESGHLTFRRSKKGMMPRANDTPHYFSDHNPLRGRACKKVQVVVVVEQRRLFCSRWWSVLAMRVTDFAKTGRG